MRLARENPEATEAELYDLGLRGGLRKSVGDTKARYFITCRKCLDEFTVSDKDWEWISKLPRGIKCHNCV